MGIDTFRKSFVGVKANRFKITGLLPAIPNLSSSGLNKSLDIYCKASQFPGSSVGLVNLNYRGRPIKFPAERAAADWPIQVYTSSLDNEDLRTIFQKWIDYINDGEHKSMNYKAYASEWTVQYDDIKGRKSDSRYTKICSLNNVFPIDISPIELTEDVTDVFAEFTLTLTYDYATFYP